MTRVFEFVAEQTSNGNAREFSVRIEEEGRDKPDLESEAFLRAHDMLLLGEVLCLEGSYLEYAHRSHP